MSQLFTHFYGKIKKIEENRFISNLTKQSIAVEAGDEIPMKNLAKRHFVSPTTVNRVQGKMSFIHMDAQTHEILDILPNRQLHALRSYFSQFPLAVRKQLQSVVIDMNTPYFIMI